MMALWKKIAAWRMERALVKMFRDPSNKNVARATKLHDAFVKRFP
jgi:hypothetical protein